MNMIANLHWAHPWAWMIATGPLCLAGWRRWRPDADVRVVAAYADRAMRPWAVRAGHVPGGALHWLVEGMLWVCVAAALAGPRQLLSLDAQGAARLAHRVNVMVAIEALPDAAPSEVGEAGGLSALARVRIALRGLQARLRGERLGLLEYARGAGLFLPCTSDMGLFNDDLDLAGPDLLRGQAGPGLAGALALALAELRREPGSAHAVLLVAGPASFAEDAPVVAGAPPLLATQVAALKAAATPVNVLWTGLGAPDGRAESLAAATGGRVAALDDADAWATLYDASIARMASNPPHAGGAFAWRELDAFPLSGAMLLLLILEAPWGAVSLRTSRRKSLSLLALAILGGTLVHAPRAFAQEPGALRWQAWNAWSHGQYARARTLYARVPGYAGRMGEGACDMRLKAYSQALDAFRAAMLAAATDSDRAHALYNLGDAAFRIQGHLREALDAFQASVILRPGDAAARRNLGLARAQWAEEHPDAVLSGILKRGPASHTSHFGDTSNSTPSRTDRQPPGEKPLVEGGQILGADGRLDVPGAPMARAGAGATLPEVDVRAARHGLRLLHDDRAELLGGLFAQDSRAAAAAAAEGAP